MFAVRAENLVKIRTIPDKDSNPVTKRIPDGVSFSVEKGEIFVIMGPSGCGKSSILRLLNRLEDPDEGSIFYNGKNIAELPVTELRRSIGLVMQIPSMFEGTVLDNILYGPSLCGADLKAKKEEIETLLPWFSFDPSILKRDPDRLSVGEKQRVNILRTIANSPDVLLLDEPTASLDAASAAGVLEIIAGINKMKNTTIIMVTHIPEHAEKAGGRIMMMEPVS
ncbi:MAG: ATP-binding cassette domain-containing protein [Firmicutes bacterium]|nr:ATP-binding cassette domain-containing protein [Bacillota bacterium]